MRNDLALELLYHRRDAFERGRHFRWHEHPFWQIDVCLSGRIEATVEREQGLLRPGDCLIIGPRQRHRFSYKDKLNRFLSIKYRIHETSRSLKVGIVARNDGLSRFASLFEHLIPHGEHAPQGDSKVMTSVLEGFLHFAGTEETTTEREEGVSQGNLVARVLQAIEGGEGRLRHVGELATLVGLTEGHLRARFKSETGMTLKEKLDTVCIERAQFLLAYTDRSISEVAAELVFPDLYSFSRFFKGRTGLSPRDYRKRYLA